MDSDLLNNLLSQIQEKTGMQFDEKLKNECKVLFDKINQPQNKNISIEQKNKVIILNNFLNSCFEMNSDSIYDILTYVTKLNKDDKEILAEFPNFEENQKQLLFIFSSIVHLIKEREIKNVNNVGNKKMDDNEINKILDNVLQENNFDINKELDNEIADELDELSKEEKPKKIENSLGDLSKLIEIAKELTSKVNLDDSPIDFNKLSDKEYFNKVAKNIQENEDILQNSDEISRLVESNPLLKNIHDQLVSRIEKSENIDYDFVKDMSEKIVKDL